MFTTSQATMPYGDQPSVQSNSVFEFATYAVTPADGADLPSGLVGYLTGTRPTKAIKVTGAGNVSVQLFGGNGTATAVLTGLVAGQLLPIAVTRILATGTTATGVLALY